MTVRGRIPEDTLAELRDRANIVEIVSGHVGLRRVGRNHVGLCPFHAEKTPSFTVNDERGIFHCFGCGVGGNVFTFLMKMEALPFPDVVERLAARYGVVLPARVEAGPAEGERESLFRLNDKTARFYERYLWDAAEAAPARAYLDERGIGRAVAERYRLGYAPAAGEVLVQRLRRAGEPPERAVRLGLISARRTGSGHYDRFRGRLIFPITDASGRVVGFGSRTVPGVESGRADAPKYVNSPETPLYRKGAHCYGLAMARDAVRHGGRVVVVEGYFDVLALAAAGVEHVVASLGTALTPEQIRLLKRFSRDIIVFFDGDQAGQRAAEKSLATFLDAGLLGRAAFLPAGDDPDTFVRRAGADALRALLDAAPLLFDFYLDRVVPPGSTVAERSRAAPGVVALLAKVGEPVERDVLVRHAAERLGLREDRLLAAERPAPAAAPARGARPPDTHAPDAEEMLLTLVLRTPELAERVAAAGVIDHFTNTAWRELMREVVQKVAAGAPVDAATVLSRLDEPTAARVSGRLVDDPADPAAIERTLDDCLARLRARELERQRQLVLRRIRADEAAGNEAAVAEGLRQLAELRPEAVDR